MPYTSGSVAVWYTVEGTGPDAIFFCHGAGGNAASWWQQLPVFASRYRCVAHDHRGFGRTRCPMSQLVVREFADDARAVMDAAGIDRAHFVCQSMGGWTGVQMALRHPDRVRSLVLADTIGGIALPSGLAATRDMAARAAAANAQTPALAADYPARDPAGAYLYAQLSAFNTELDQAELFRRLFSRDALVAVEDAARVRVPVLVIAGTRDLIWSPQILRELAAQLPDARVVEIDAGHSAYFETPRAFNAALRTFLAEHDGGPLA
jgi:pimeloyl-ACP methyl ester carboxylesterase